MTRTQIVAELRRSAAEDQRPWIISTPPAWKVAISWMNLDAEPTSYTNDDVAMYFLIVACALEDE